MHHFVCEVEIVTMAGAVYERRRVNAPCLKNTRAPKLGDELAVSEAVNMCV